ncbi:hypothetical protein AIGOOFII_1211 [Methylobacterium marchantiae]|nr:hypothetical protein AIGOOFII_1211 [Methylobacterium marchantiae]
MRDGQVALVSTGLGRSQRPVKAGLGAIERPSKDPEVAEIDGDPNVAGIETGGLRELVAGGGVTQLKPVDAGLVGEEPRLRPADLLAQGAGGFAALAQGASRLVEPAVIDQSQGALADRREFRPVVGQAEEVIAQAEDLLRRFVEPGGDLRGGHIGLAQPAQHSLQRRLRHALLDRERMQLPLDRLELGAHALGGPPRRGGVLGDPRQQVEIAQRPGAQHLQPVEPGDDGVELGVLPLDRVEGRLPDVARDLFHGDVERLARLGIFLRALDDLGEGGEHQLAEGAGRAVAFGHQPGQGDPPIDRGNLGLGPARQRRQRLDEAAGDGAPESLMPAGRDQLGNAVHDRLDMPVDGGGAGVFPPVQGEGARIEQGVLDQAVEPRHGVGLGPPFPLADRGPSRLHDLLRRLDPGEPGGARKVMVRRDGLERVVVAETLQRPLLQMRRAQGGSRARQSPQAQVE